MSDRVRLIDSTPDTARSRREIYPEISAVYIHGNYVSGEALLERCNDSLQMQKDPGPSIMGT